MNEWVQLVGGGLLLYFGAQWLVEGASSLALALRVPQLIVGLTVVAYGTSAPEVIVSVQAAAAGHSDVSLGNVIGSNIANIGLVLGLATLIAPARVDGALRRRELPVLLASTLVLPLILWDGAVQLWEAAFLLLCGLGYTAWMIHAARGSAERTAASSDTAEAELDAEIAGAPKPKSTLRTAITAAVGLGILLVGGHLFVAGAVTTAHTLGMSEQLVGLTIVAVGTSLPELVTSLIAARRGHADLGVGNVIGSNIFNVFLCLGTAGLAGPVGAPLEALGLELIALGVMTALIAVFIRRERTISRVEGGIALALYVAFTVFTVLRG